MRVPESPERKLLFLFRILVSAGLLSYLLVWKIDSEEVLDLLKGASIPLFLAAVGMKTIERILMSWRWLLILRSKKLKVRLWDMLRIDFLANFTGIFLPSSAGGEVIRVYSLSSKISSATESMSSLAVDRLLSVFAQLTTAMACLLMPAAKRLPPEMFSLVLLIFGVFLLLTALFMKGALVGILRKLPRILPVRWILEKAEKFQQSFQAFHNSKRALRRALALAYLCQGTRIITLYLVCMAIGPKTSISLVYFFIFVPLIFLVTLFPVSLGGLGVREAGFVYFFQPVGLLKEEAFSMSLLAYAVVILLALPGGFFYASSGFRDRKEGNAE